MFDVGFFELLLIGMIALVVVGPERLPKVAQTAGKWVGAAKRYAMSLQRQLDAEVRIEEMNRKIMEAHPNEPTAEENIKKLQQEEQNK
ncbi:Sec-independent protein translocase protein TatB [Salinibius halmophilus]|uniref:Sec-independent protein translocase protein TatB n=1 Tax=Salinibius halmophilus TaxID=1853216 RepID=UPI000E6604BC|nr:Sec-independent protein translocase protein TatB [Salinibius halmophilus]